MNQVQRKFLIERIQTKVKEKIEVLNKSMSEYPSASNFIFKAILNGELRLQEQEVILAALKAKALGAKEGANWLSNERMGANKESTVILQIKELLVLPEDYNDELQRVRLHNKNIQEEIAQLRVQLETIEVRIQLASDKTLQNLISEVDDMGNLSLIDAKIKLLDK